MRYRKLDANGDMVFGGQQNSFYIDSPEAVGQAIKTRLGLWTGEWFLDTAAGMDWKMKVLGKYTGDTRDMAIRARILGTTGVDSIASYSSTFSADTRAFSVTATVDTTYGTTTTTSEGS